MRIPADDIPARGIPVEADLSTPWLADAARFALESMPSALSMSLLVTKDGERLVVTGTGEVVLAATCDRCLADLTLTLSGPVRPQRRRRS
jgi:uncharacterized metal-binding protein YceD (DUF177 family)